ncbi:Rieske (2Fe-2S) protein [Nocardiopsis sp. FR6]|uniref:Rieske (2Fe-2S) protein n=1 Tax=Nocardiopsis sp. FR6 TaxID=2605986 RepID=UPI001F1D4C3F|nr:Rieske 2Fe-2S domain-containing protein [Nocardiopsis sp. FR6]
MTDDLVLIEVAGRRLITEARCPHRKGRLRFAHVDEQTLRIRCQLHYSTFDLRNGEIVTGPACTPLRVVTHLGDADGDTSGATGRE